jgi:LL-diaminopimelate aminotransferase
MSGRAGVLQEDGKWSNVVYIPCTSDNDFIPQIPDKRIDILYLCYPNNPTGTTLTKEELKKWVNYALANDTLILFDAAYEAYIQDPKSPTLFMKLKVLENVPLNFVVFQKQQGLQE